MIPSISLTYDIDIIDFTTGGAVVARVVRSKSIALLVAGVAVTELAWLRYWEGYRWVAKRPPRPGFTARLS